MDLLFKRYRWFLLILISMMQPACKHQEVNGQNIYYNHLKSNQVKTATHKNIRHGQH